MQKPASYEVFLKLLDNEDKAGAVRFAINLIQSEQLSLEVLYEQILTPSLNEFYCKLDDRELCVWKEHTRTSIIRTIVENTYPFAAEIAKKAKPTGKSVIIACPSEEYHEIGALIVSHLFLMNGFLPHFIGANTPKADILSAVKALKPDFLALSVTNYYNIIQTKQITDEVVAKHPSVKIIIGGSAFAGADAHGAIHHHFHMNSFQDIRTLAAEVLQ